MPCTFKNGIYKNVIKHKLFFDLNSSKYDFIKKTENTKRPIILKPLFFTKFKKVQMMNKKYNSKLPGES
jgi:hypothetical protein